MTEDKEFWDRVDHGDPSRCWPWKGSRNRDGYGTLRWGASTDLAHRVALGLSGADDVTRRSVVRHRCDNPPCCNPAHLELGTQADNVRDMDLRGRRRSARGENHGLAKLSNAEVVDIRAWFAVGGWSKQDLAEAFGVSDCQIGNIVRGKQRRGP